MKKHFTILLLTVTLSTYGQSGKFNPFKLIVIRPDTAIIDKSLYGDIDSVQSDYIERYYYSVRQMEQIVNSNISDDSSFKATQELMKVELIAAKAAESEVKKFRYYQALSAYSTEAYSFYFNEYEPFSKIIELHSQNTDMASLKKLVDTSNADYIVFFSKVHTENTGGLLILKLTTSLYSRKQNKIVFAKETVGDTNSRGGMWTCGTTTLSCLLINGVRTSTDEIVPLIAKAQMRQ